MDRVDDALLADLMAAMAKAARDEVMPRFQSVLSDSTRVKTGPDDLVTDADLSAERALTAALATLIPDVLVVGEEAASDDPTILDRLRGEGPVAVVDPVDGTWYFAHGLPFFGMILALVAGGRTLAGIIHYPVTGEFILARPGLGAWHVAADGARRRLQVAPPAPVAEMSALVTPYRLPDGMRESVALGSLRFRSSFSWRCSAQDYRAVAGGAVGVLLTEGLMPWDHAAGVLIHAEAGGYSALWDGSPYHPAVTKGYLLLAPDAASWQAAREVLGGQGGN